MIYKKKTVGNNKDQIQFKFFKFYLKTIIINIIKI